jgi:chromosome segregation ATPase
MKSEEHPLSQKPLIERITPGPWTIRHGSGIEKVIRAEGFGAICVLESPANTEIMDELEDEQTANAEAISRVPELLKAEQERDSLNEQLETGATQYAYAVVKISELEETIARLKQELKEERNSGRDINYDFHEGRGEGNEIL